MVRSLLLCCLLLLAWPAAAGAAGGPAGSQTFRATGHRQTFTVPAGVEYVTVTAQGSSGAVNGNTGAPGHGAVVQTTLALTPGTQLAIDVGQTDGESGFRSGGRHGVADNLCKTGAPGGSSTGVSDAGSVYVVAGAGGGGGGDCSGFGDGGSGGSGGRVPTGGRNGADASPPQTGIGGCGACYDDDGHGQNGHDAGSVFLGGGGGGGGGGYRRGGAGGWDGWEGSGDAAGGGGGAGDSYVVDGARNTQITTASRAGDGWVRIAWGGTPAAVSATDGGDQQTVVGTPFARALEAEVVDADGIPLSGVSVTFTLPSEGPSGTFAGGGTTAVAQTAPDGRAVAPPVTAGAVSGPWTAEATIAGVDDPARYALESTDAATTTSVAGSATSPVRGQAMSFTAHVATGSPLPATGRVRFTVDGAALAGPAAIDPTTGDARSAATSDLAVGSHAVVAEYLGDDGHARSTSAVLLVVVARATTTTALSSTRNPSGAGDAVAFTATVATAAPGAVAPTGAVQFAVDGVDFGAPVAVDAGGTAASPVRTDLGLGAHTVTAVYQGAPDTAASTGRLVQSVGPEATATTVSASSDPVRRGQALTLTATVARTDPGVVATGSATFRVDGTTACADVALSGAVATCAVTAPLDPGVHAVAVDYGGGAGADPSSGALQLTALAADTAVAVTATPSTSTFGAGLEVRAMVAALAPGRGTPSGAVQLSVDGIDLGTPIALTDGVAVLGDLPSLSVGTHVVEARYTGATGFAAAAAATTHVVQPAAPAIAVVASADPVAPGDPVRFTATLSAAQGLVRPGGAVRFLVDDRPVGSTAALVAGRATSDWVTGLASGAHRVTVQYPGSSSFTAGQATAAFAVSAPPAGGGGGGAPAPTGVGGVAADAGADGGAPTGVAAEPVILVARARVTTDRADVSPSGTIALPVACAGPLGARCEGRLVLRSATGVTLGMRLLSLPAGGAATLAVDLDGAGERAVSAGARVPVTAVVETGLGAAGPPTALTLIGAQAPRVAIAPQRVRIDRRGRVAVGLRCVPAAVRTRCTTQLSLALGGRVVARRTVTVRAGAEGTAHLTLPARVRAVVAARGGARLHLRARSTIAVGADRTSTGTLEVRAR